MRAHGSKSGVKNETPKLPEPREYLGKIWDFPSPKLQFSSHKIQFSSTAFRFPRNPRKISLTAFQFLQRLSAFFNGFPIFLNGFPLSEKYEKIYLRWQIYKRSLFELRISRHLLPELRNSC
jgi:hypothetical protein